MGLERNPPSFILNMIFPVISKLENGRFWINCSLLPNGLIFMPTDMFVILNVPVDWAIFESVFEGLDEVQNG